MSITPLQNSLSRADLMIKYCECGRTESEGYPKWCKTCKTFTHPVYKHPKHKCTIVEEYK